MKQRSAAGLALIAIGAACCAHALAVRDRNGGDIQFFFKGQDAARHLVAVVRTGSDGARLWQTAYDDFETAAGVAVPRLIRFAEGNAGFDDGVEINFKDRTVNAPMPPNAFVLAAPPNVPVRDVGCGPAPPPS